MNAGECSGSKFEEDVWAKLVLPDLRFPGIEIKSNEMVVCSEITPTSVERHSWCKITRGEDLISASIQNISSNTILVDNAVLNKEESMAIKCGNEVVAGPDRKGYSVYIFRLMPIENQCTKYAQISLDVENTKCSICLNVWHDVVTVSPCLHNFCNGCFSEWLRRSQKKQKGVICPQCRAVVHSVGRNHFLHQIEEVVLQSLPSLRRSNEELAPLNKFASIKSNLVIRSGNVVSRKRSPPSLGDDDLETEILCPQCGTELGGFMCCRSTSHLQCQLCGGMMPSRANIAVPQHCLGCNGTFCGAYWQSQGVIASDIPMICRSETFMPIAERSISRVPISTHQNNQYEKDITERCIQREGRTLQEVISDFIVKLSNREIDRARMPLQHSEAVTGGTYLCYECYEKLVAFLLYWYRISMPKCVLPPDAYNRDDCWYGYECRTQHHSNDHALKRNHVCHPTRGTHGR